MYNFLPLYDCIYTSVINFFKEGTYSGFFDFGRFCIFRMSLFADDLKMSFQVEQINLSN